MPALFQLLALLKGSPTFLVVLAMALGFAAQNRGLLTPEQVTLVIAALGAGGTKVAHGMTPPRKP